MRTTQPFAALAVDHSEQSGHADQSKPTGLIRRRGLKVQFRQRVNTDVQYGKILFVGEVKHANLF